MPFYTYKNNLTGTEHEFMLPYQHEIPKDKHGNPMTRVFKATHNVIPTDRVNEKSSSYQQSYIDEKGV